MKKTKIKNSSDSLLNLNKKLLMKKTPKVFKKSVLSRRSQNLIWQTNISSYLKDNYSEKASCTSYSA